MSAPETIQDRQHPVCILGGGPAGMSCALWLKNLGLQPFILEQKVTTGGMQNLNFLVNNSVLGFAAQTGTTLATHFARHLTDNHIESVLGARVTHITRTPQNHLAVSFCTAAATNPQQRLCQAVVVALGTRYRAQEVLSPVTGFEHIDPDHICYGPYAFAQTQSLHQLRVLILGGGDNAIENARMLTSVDAKVYVVARAGFRAQRNLLRAVELDKRCILLAHTCLTEVHSQQNAYKIQLATQGEPDRTIFVDRLHVLAGYEPNTACLKQILAPQLYQMLTFDTANYLHSDRAGRTGCPGIYAAGDVCNPAFPSVVSALAQGAQVAKTIESDSR